MSWSTPKDLRAQLERLWDRGELLRGKDFPLKLALKGPSSTDITERFDAVRNWAAELNRARFLRVEWQEVRHRVQGLQRLPASVWVDSLDDALDWLGRRSDWKRFSNLLDSTGKACPSLLPWLEKRPLLALELSEEWARLLAVVNWVQRHPRPGIYPRQADIPGVHSKYIESHRAVLAELLDLALPEEAVDFSKTGNSGFSARYGFLEKPSRIRFRILDPGLNIVPGTFRPDITLDAESFARLEIDVRRVFITENEINFLSLPDFPGAIAIFGAGYGWDALARAGWLCRCILHYWGDIDTHGFAILAQLRAHFSHVESMLMDRETLEAHCAFWGREDRPQRGDLPGLTQAEAALYDDLRYDRIREGLRLEQEHVGFDRVREQISRLAQHNFRRSLKLY